MAKQLEKLEVPGMRHLNSNILCVITLRTTGDNPEKDDIIELLVMLLDNNINPYLKITPFYCRIQPTHREEDYRDGLKGRKKIEYLKSKVDGIPDDRALMLFEDWYKKLNLQEQKRLIPLTFNYPYVSAFLRSWMSHTYFASYFSDNYRDILPVANYLNDQADFKVTNVPFSKQDFKYLISSCKLPNPDHDLIQRAVAITDVHKYQMRFL